MCPVCLATAMLIAGSATSTGGLTAFAIKKIGAMNKIAQNTGAREAAPEASQRRDQDVNVQDRRTPNRVAG
jgi:hypothetical protein